MMVTLKALFSLIIMLYCFFAVATPVEIKQGFESSKVNSIYYSFKPISLNEALRSNINSWHLLKNTSVNLGLDKRPVWIRFSINNTLGNDFIALLSLDNPLLNQVDAYQLQNNETLSSKNIGETLALSGQRIKGQPLVIKLALPANSNNTVILKVANSTGLHVPLSLWQQDAFLAHKSKFNLLNGFLIGFVFSLAISSFILYGFSRKPYFAYTGMITLTQGLLLCYFCGFAFRYFHPNLSAVQQLIVPILVMLTTLLFFPLQQQICQLKTPKLLTEKKVLASVLVIITLFIWLSPLIVVTLFCLIAAPLLLSFFILTTFFYVRRKPSNPNKAFLIAVSLFFIAIVYFAVVVSGIYMLNINNLVVIFVSFLLCMFFLSYAVMKLFFLQRDEQVTAQQAFIAISSAQDTLLKERLTLQEDNRLELESQVDERTFELQVTLRELEEKNRELEQLNMHDALTGVKNRRFFDKKLVMELRRSRREQTPLAIIMLDIDRFKAINDTYGHLTGDQVIRSVSDIIKENLNRPLDEVARYGGEEFVVLLPNTPDKGAVEIAQKIRSAIAQSAVNVAGTDITFTISAGVYCCVAEDINNPNLFTECADKALYYAKQNGRNKVVTFPIPH
jgi:diguanylate cyclase (GGDEF)-like protein